VIEPGALPIEVPRRLICDLQHRRIQEEFVVVETRSGEVNWTKMVLVSLWLSIVIVSGSAGRIANRAGDITGFVPATILLPDQQFEAHAWAVRTL